MNVSVAGAELHCESRGRGPACLVLCSSGTAPYQRQLPAALDQVLTLVFVDLRGSGRSTGLAGELTFDVLAEDLEAVRRQLGRPQVAVFGHSIQGALAIEYARRCPAAVSQVIAVGTPPAGDMTALMARGNAFFAADASDERKRLLQENLAALPPGAAMDEMLYAQTPLRFHDPRFQARPLFDGAIVRPEILGQLMGKLAPGWQVSSDPAWLTVPLLVALGRHDYVVPWVLWQELPAPLPTATLVLFERSGHQPFVEEPARFVEVVSRFLTASGGPSSGPAAAPPSRAAPG